MMMVVMVMMMMKTMMMVMVMMMMKMMLTIMKMMVMVMMTMMMMKIPLFPQVIGTPQRSSVPAGLLLTSPHTPNTHLQTQETSPWSTGSVKRCTVPDRLRICFWVCVCVSNRNHDSPMILN